MNRAPVQYKGLPPQKNVAAPRSGGRGSGHHAKKRPEHSRGGARDSRSRQGPRRW